jgi:ubiquinone/menaquinone biosynthesis C-methylase UbiE
LTRRSRSDFLSPVPDEPPQPPDRAAVIAREAAFHDALVQTLDPATAPPGPPDSWERAILGALGPLNGRDVLDYGCGDGSLSIQLADAGAARVTGIDVSTASIHFARERAARFRPHASVEFVAGSAESTGLGDESFDLVAGKFVLHHLDLPAAVEELHRLLRTGGHGVFIETSGLNPLVLALRAQIVHRGRFGAVRVGTEDEHPVSRADLRALRARFREVRVDYPIFWLFRPFARQVLAARHPRAGHRVAGLDELIERHAPRLRPLSYHMRITVTK